MENLIDQLMELEARLAEFNRKTNGNFGDLGEMYVQEMERQIKYLEKKIDWQNEIERLNNDYIMILN